MFAARYFGPRQFGRRYFGKAGLTIQGTYFGGRYFGSRYFGGRYWSADPAAGESFTLAQTTGIGLSGSLSAGSTALAFASPFTVTQTNTLGLNASALVNGSFIIDETDNDFNLTPPLDGPVMAGVIGVTGDIVIVTGGAPVIGSYWGKRYFGNRQFGGRYFGRPPAWNLDVTQGISIAGAANVAGSLGVTIGLDFGAGIALNATLGAGSAEFTIPSPTPEDATRPSGGWALGRERKKRRYDYLSPPTKEQMAERVKKQREALGILPPSVQKRIETAVKKEVKRPEPEIAALAPVAAEVAQEAEVPVKDVIEAIRRTYENQIALIAARVEADKARELEEQATAAAEAKERAMAVTKARLAAEAKAAEKAKLSALAREPHLANLHKDDEAILTAAQKQREQVTQTLRKLQERILKMMR